MKEILKELLIRTEQKQEEPNAQPLTSRQLAWRIVLSVGQGYSKTFVANNELADIRELLQDDEVLREVVILLIRIVSKMLQQQHPAEQRSAKKHTK